MKLFYRKFRIGLMTFALGLACVFMFQGSLYSGEIYVDLPEVNSDSVIEITPLNKMIFVMTGQGCGLLNHYGGRGSGTSYLSTYLDNQSVLRESSCHEKLNNAEKELKSRISEAKKVLEFEKKSGKDTRYVLEMEEKDEKWIDILIFDGERCITIISAPTLKPALEFEKYWKLKIEN